MRKVENVEKRKNRVRGGEEVKNYKEIMMKIVTTNRVASHRLFD